MHTGYAYITFGSPLQGFRHCLKRKLQIERMQTDTQNVYPLNIARSTHNSL